MSESISEVSYDPFLRVWKEARGLPLEDERCAFDSEYEAAWFHLNLLLRADARGNLLAENRRAFASEMREICEVFEREWRSVRGDSSAADAAHGEMLNVLAAIELYEQDSAGFGARRVLKALGEYSRAIDAYSGQAPDEDCAAAFLQNEKPIFD